MATQHSAVFWITNRSQWLQVQLGTELQMPTPRWYTDIIVEQLTLTFFLDNDKVYNRPS
ncbi:hypothetical protein ACFLUS_05820 [Chloroflexota bacterium]